MVWVHINDGDVRVGSSVGVGINVVWVKIGDGDVCVGISNGVVGDGVQIGDGDVCVVGEIGILRYQFGYQFGDQC